MEVAPADTHRKNKLIVGLGLACIFAAFFAAVVRLHPKNFFGYTHDDSIYFSSAKGLAEGKGYVLPSVPGTPAATKYPILYPWLLSWVWRWNPSFPANLGDAIAFNSILGAAFLAVAFWFFRHTKGIGEIETLFLTAFCALHPLVIFYSGTLRSEILFATLVLASLLVADSAIRPNGRASSVILCAVLVGLSMLVRVFALPVAAGIVITGIHRRARRQLLFFSAVLGPFFALLCWKVISPDLPKSPVSGPLASSTGWVHTWTYYTDYVNVWRQGVPTFPIFLAMLKNNALLLLSTPGSYFLYPLLTGQNTIERIAIVIATAASLIGIWRQARTAGLRPIHFCLPLYAALVLVWNYPQADRFLLPFVPLFAAGVWLEAKRVLRLVAAALLAHGTSVSTVTERIFAGAIAVVGSAFVAAIALNFVGVRGLWSNVSRNRAALLQEKLEAYSWIARSSPLDARIVAYEDASLYLYTGRQAIRPFTFTTAEFFDPTRLEFDLDHLYDVPVAIRAQYWVDSEDDYAFEWPEAYAKFQERMKVIGQTLPIVFRSKGGHVRIYLLGCSPQFGRNKCDGDHEIGDRSSAQ